jgi:hypothetical protein
MLRIAELEQYMFSAKNMEASVKKEEEKILVLPEKKDFKKKENTKNLPITGMIKIKQKDVAAYLKEEEEEEEKEKKEKEKKKREELVPRHRDKLFWCFYIIYKGEHDYEQHLADNFITEKNFKIATAEKLKELKDKFKRAKLRISEIEDELINKQCITLKGLHALCLVYDVSIMYVANKKYSEFLYDLEASEAAGASASEAGSIEPEIICLKEHEKGNKYFIKCFEDENQENKKQYIKSVREGYWKIENVDKPLKVPSAYTLKELQEIGEKLGLALKSDLGKNKTKPILYQEILEKL